MAGGVEAAKRKKERMPLSVDGIQKVIEDNGSDINRQDFDTLLEWISKHTTAEQVQKLERAISNRSNKINKAISISNPIACLTGIAKNHQTVLVDFVTKWVSESAKPEEARQFEIVAGERFDKLIETSSEILIRKSLSLKPQANGNIRLVEQFTAENGKSTTRSIFKVSAEERRRTIYKIPHQVKEFINLHHPELKADLNLN